MRNQIRKSLAAAVGGVVVIFVGHALASIAGLSGWVGVLIAVLVVALLAASLVVMRMSRHD